MTRILLHSKPHSLNYVLDVLEKKRIEASVIDPSPLAMLREKEAILKTRVDAVGKEIGTIESC